MNPMDMKRGSQSKAAARGLRLVFLGMLFSLLLGAGSCGGPGIVLNYPAEELDFQLRNLKTPALYIESVTDMRSAEQRRGGGHFLRIDYPKQGDWLVDPTTVYAEALAQDVEQTHLVELVPLRGQADYVLSADVLSLGCRFERSWSSYFFPALLGAGVGVAAGDDMSHRVKLGAVLGAVAVMATPMSSKNRAEAEVRLTLKDKTGNVLWQATCLGEMEDRVFVAATSRRDQDLVDRFLPAAIKKCNACLLGQMRQAMIELGSQ
jgi:hypothetical protein